MALVSWSAKRSVHAAVDLSICRVLNHSIILIFSLQITWADLAYFSVLAPWTEQYGDYVLPDTLPHLKKLIELVGNGNIKSYIDSQPKTAV